MAERSVVIEDQVDWTITVTARRRSHVDPYVNGATVKCRHEFMTLHSILDPDYDIEETGRMKNAGQPFGIVVDRVWHIDRYELARAEVDPVFNCSRNKPHLRNVNIDLYYQVMFPTGLFWARYDWLEEVSTG